MDIQQSALNRLSLMSARPGNREGVLLAALLDELESVAPRPAADAAVTRLVSRGFVFVTHDGKLRVRSASPGSPRSIHAVDRIR